MRRSPCSFSITSFDELKFIAYNRQHHENRDSSEIFPEGDGHLRLRQHVRTGATQEEIRVEICAQCHPFYTGEEKLIDTAGRVEKFKSRRAAKVEPKPKKIRLKKQ